MTYQTVYVLFLTMSKVCPIDDPPETALASYCPEYHDPRISKESDGAKIVMYNWLYPYCCAAVIIIFIELSIYLAFYKDVIFASVTLANYLGMMVETYVTM